MTNHNNISEHTGGEAHHGGARAGKLGVMVCVTGQRSCERLIVHGAERKVPDQKLYIVHCVQTGHNFMNTPFEADAIEYLFTAARLVGAELTILREDSVIDALVNFANVNSVGLIVLGASPQDGSDSFVRKFRMRLPETEFEVVRANAEQAGAEAL